MKKVKHVYDHDLRQLRIVGFVLLGALLICMIGHLILRNWVIAATCGLWAAVAALNMKVTRLLQAQRDNTRLLKAMFEQEGHR